MALCDTGDLATDLHQAIAAAGAADIVPHTRDELQRVLDYEKISRGLRAEAGMSNGPFIVILHSHAERLRNGMRLLRFLTFSPTPVGDAIYWNISVPDTYKGITCPVLKTAEGACELLHHIGGGLDHVELSNAIAVPSAADLKRLG